MAVQQSIFLGNFFIYLFFLQKNCLLKLCFNYKNDLALCFMYLKWIDFRASTFWLFDGIAFCKLNAILLDFTVVWTNLHENWRKKTFTRIKMTQSTKSVKINLHVIINPRTIYVLYSKGYLIYLRICRLLSPEIHW